MVDGVWKGVYPKIFGRSHQLFLNKFFYPGTPSKRKGRDGDKKMKKKMEEKIIKNNGENSGTLSSLPVDRLTLTDCKADRSCQNSISVSIVHFLSLHFYLYEVQV